MTPDEAIRRMERATAAGLLEAREAEDAYLEMGRRLAGRSDMVDRGVRLTGEAWVRFGRMSREHSAITLAVVSREAASIARGAALTGPSIADLETTWRGLADRLALVEDPTLETDQIDRIVTTEAWRAYNGARADVERALIASRPTTFSRDAGDWMPVLIASWDATLDRRTCEVCRGLAGRRRLLGAAWDRGDPPAHPRCRCAVGWLAVPAPNVV